MSKPTVLVVKTHALGDLLMATAALQELRVSVPDVTIAVLTTAACAPLLEHNPDVDRIITLRDLKPMAFLQTIPKLRRLAPSHALVFQLSAFAHVMARMSSATARAGLPALVRASEWPPAFDQYTGDVYQALVNRIVDHPSGTRFRPRLCLTAREMSAARGLTGDGEYVVVAPGGGRNLRQSVAEKRWPPDRFAQLCDLVTDEWGAPVVLVGSASDRDVTATVRRQAYKPLQDLTGRTDLRTLGGVVANAMIVITNDSLVLHLAVALNRPLVGIFGPTSSANFIPPGRISQRGVSARIPCSPCYGNGRFPGCRLGRATCMEDVSVDRVMDACRRSIEA